MNQSIPRKKPTKTQRPTKGRGDAKACPPLISLRHLVDPTGGFLFKFCCSAASLSLSRSILSNTFASSIDKAVGFCFWCCDDLLPAFPLPPPPPPPPPIASAADRLACSTRSTVCRILASERSMGYSERISAVTKAAVESRNASSSVARSFVTAAKPSTGRCSTLVGGGGGWAEW